MPIGGSPFSIGNLLVLILPFGGNKTGGPRFLSPQMLLGENGGPFGEKRRESQKGGRQGQNTFISLPSQRKFRKKGITPGG